MKKRNYQQDDHSCTAPRLSTGQKVWRIFRPFVILACSLAIVLGVAWKGFDFLLDRFVRPVNPENPQTITLEITRGMSTSSIANALYDTDGDGSERLIRNKAIFKIYVDFMGKGGNLKSGTYEFDQSMGIPQIVDMLCAGDGKVREVMTIKITEGLNVESMARALVAQGALENTEEFLRLCNEPEEFADYINPQEFEDVQERRYLLEGYLFPDTYEIYKGESASSIIARMLRRYNEILTVSDAERAQELGMSMDEVMTLASLIEKEARSGDFEKVSAVFHNRLKEGMLLQSCPTVQYVLGIRNYVLTAEQVAVDSPYNTYKYKGLPAGPICNPGRAAITAALYPEEEYLNDGYLYFCLEVPYDPAVEGSGNLAFAKTLEEHNENVAKYKEGWLEHDAQQSAQ